MCMQPVNQYILCYVNETITATANSTTTDCDPPLAFDCKQTDVDAGVYAQLAGTAYNCSLTTPSPAYASSPRVGGPVLPVLSSNLTGTPVNSRNYTLVFQANSSAPAPSPLSGVRYAKTPLLQAGQVQPPPKHANLFLAPSNP